jgi:curved DNA-binding protein
MVFIDYYKVLGVDKSVNDTDIKKAFRKLARKYHPDVNPKDETAKAKFQNINEANEVLSDPEKRRKYDKYGKDWKHADEFEKQGQSRKQRTAQSSRSGFDDQDYSSFFESMFGNMGGGRERSSIYKGQDYASEIRLNLLDVLEPHKQTLTVNGKNIRITIPAGVENGQTIKISGHGGEGVNGGPKGDLYISFVIENKTKFKREGSNLYFDFVLDLYKAILGGEITVDTLTSKVKLTIPSGTQNGAKVKLKGKGMPVYKKAGEFGDLIVTYQVKIPTDLSEKQIDLFRKIEKMKN